MDYQKQLGQGKTNGKIQYKHQMNLIFYWWESNSWRSSTTNMSVTVVMPKFHMMTIICSIMKKSLTLVMNTSPWSCLKYVELHVDPQAS